MYIHLGLIKGGNFQRYTNFEIEVLFSAETPEDVSSQLSGFVYRVRSNDGVYR